MVLISTSNSFLVKTFVCMVCVLGFHFLAAWGGWYQKLSQLDTVVHLAGGVTVGFMWLWLRARSAVEESKSLPAWYVFSSLIGTVLVVGLLWELFEYTMWLLAPVTADSYAFYSPQVSDVLTDLCADLIGGLLVGSVVMQGERRKHSV